MLRIPVNIAEFGEDAYIEMCAYKEELRSCECSCGHMHLVHSRWIPTFIHIANETLNTFDIVTLEEYPDLLEVLRGTQPNDWNQNEK